MINLGGTYRAKTPQETLLHIEPMLWDKFGITRVANVTGLDNINIPTYVAIRPHSKLLSTSQGKGATDDLAKISAIMESIECWHSENLPDPDLMGSYNQLSEKYNLVKLDLLLNGLVKSNSNYTKDLEFSWLKGTELNSQRPIYFPLSLIDLNTTPLNSAGSRGEFCASTNGLAAGNTFEEALCHALYEVIERHCWTNSDANPPRYIDLSSITTPHLRSLLDHIDPTVMRLQVNDITDELNVPAFVANLYDLSGVHGVGTFTGAGAHLSSEVAFSRAVTEVIQSRLTFISGSRDDLYPSVYHAIKSQARSHIGLIPEEKTLFPFIETDVPRDFNACIQHLLNRLKQIELDQVIVYDHTRPEIDIPVVHVIVPGMQSDLFRHLNLAYFPDQL